MTSTIQPRPKWRILLVDDHRDTRYSLKMYLTKGGHTVTEADCVETALAALERQPEIQVLLSDIGLPDGTGWQLLKQVKENKLNPDLQAIAMSGFGTLGDHNRSAEAGFTTHLVKPFRLASLGEALDKLAAHQKETV